jgi:hypothetical protein
VSKINRVRLINLNYNNNAIRISDETFHLNGESTLLSLRNGGGKSVLVQMMTAPFVHKRYRDAKDRPFESYFTTNKPSFILVEWALDQGAGYVLTGMMVRRSQDTENGNGESLEMVNIVSEYQEPCLQDIHNLPVVEKGRKEMILKNFAACRQMFEGYKKDRSMKFFYYDMNNAAQSRQYFHKLKEYQINDKEWETIIKKVNLKESGLSDLFADCKDEKGLIDKWFLDAVESKLNKDKNRVKGFQAIVEKYVGQYKDNQSKIQRRDNIRAFKEEALRIQEKARLYQESDRKKQEQENRIAHFIKELNRLWNLTQTEHKRVLEQLEAINQAAARVEYEKLSSEIYHLEDEQSFHISNRDMIGMEQEELEREAGEIEKYLHLLVCAKQQELTKEEETELLLVRQKLEISRKKDEDLEPERNYLGYMLKGYYENVLEKNKEEQRTTETLHGEALGNILLEKEKISNLEQEIREKMSGEGALKSKVETYSQQEEYYNVLYKENITRNILGLYEPGTLEIRRESYEKELEEEVRERLRKKKQLEGSRNEQRRLERILTDMGEEQIRKKIEKEHQEKTRSHYTRELETRRAILKYLDLDEKSLFNMEKILGTSERKLSEISALRRNLEKEEDVLQKDYQSLTQGKVLELPKELEAELGNMGMHIIYGMEWLQKNGNTERQNQELVRSHPFLPYALILSEQEMKKLAQNSGNIYTSFPIPIIVREHLEQKKVGDTGSMIQFSGVSFYVLFNENLLNEEKLRLLVREKEQQIHRKKEAIAIRQTEYREYFEWQETLKNQEVDKQNYTANEESLKELDLQLDKLDGDIRKMSGELAELKAELGRLESAIQKADQDIFYQNRRLDDYAQLCDAYKVYEQNREALEKCRRDINRLQENQKLAQTQLERQQEKQRTLEAERDRLEREGLRLGESCGRYERYEETGVFKNNAAKEYTDRGVGSDITVIDIAEDDAMKMEARYGAITANMSQELWELESQEQKAVKRHKDAVDELEHLREKYHLKLGAWSGMRYERKEESHREVLLEDRRRKLEVKKGFWNEEDKYIAVLSQQREDRIKRINSECGEEKPLPRSEIQDQDFDARKNQLRYQEKEIQKHENRLKVHLQSYNENLTALAEYNELALKEDVVWDQNFSEMDSRSLRDFKGILVRDYNHEMRERQETKERLVQVLNQIVRMERFQEEYYKKPLESMLELTGEASQVLRQLATTLKSYDSLMEKLEVDISLVEREKKKIVELMEDYIREVHQNMGKIDHNSTITIRERPVKMLKIQLPEWEENQSLYQMRLQDFIDEITKRGIRLFEKNENAQEYFGTQITTRNLYDMVIGVGNIQIRLYKIEEQREYPITWAEVARNSGGEGFLSAFVILSSLLYYMRKDDTDIFADRNEGKVLLMDNPFAQTNAAHLLKPLMDMANKTNTQLICLTGLGGESIYNRFDNIYILNLIAASLRNGMQYLKADHLRGDEPETLVVSQIEVVEQQELVF